MKYFFLFFFKRAYSFTERGLWGGCPPSLALHFPPTPLSGGSWHYLPREEEQVWALCGRRRGAGAWETSLVGADPPPPHGKRRHGFSEGEKLFSRGRHANRFENKEKPYYCNLGLLGFT